MTPITLIEHWVEATEANPATVYYCKAGIQTGETIRVLHNGKVFNTAGVTLTNTNASMQHDNSTGKPKASGARCVLKITRGQVHFTVSKL